MAVMVAHVEEEVISGGVDEMVGEEGPSWCVGGRWIAPKLSFG